VSRTLLPVARSTAAWHLAMAARRSATGIAAAAGTVGRNACRRAPARPATAAAAGLMNVAASVAHAAPTHRTQKGDLCAPTQRARSPPHMYVHKDKEVVSRTCTRAAPRACHAPD
jgi:hypothetical protein